MLRGNSMRVGITSGVISSLIVLLFIQPILSFVWRLLTSVIGRIHQGFVDNIYREASFGTRDWTGHFIVLFLCVALILGISLLPAHPILRDRIDRHRVTRAAGRTMFFFAIGSGFLSVILGFIFATLAYGNFCLNASFDQRITVMQPQLSDAEVKIFRARWAAMQSEAEYNGLMTDLDNTAKARGIRLPPLLLK